MTDMELADRIAKTHSSWDYLCCTHEEREQIIAALRRGPERPPSGEMRLIGEIVDIADGIGTVICQWNEDRYICPAGTKIYAMLSDTEAKGSSK